MPVPPPAGKYFGYHLADNEGRGHAWTDSELAEVAKGGGANIHRFTVEWRMVEPEPGVWSAKGWQYYGDMYSALVARGMRPLITLGGVPPWARLPEYRSCTTGRGCEYAPAPWFDDEWGRFAGEVVKRFPQTVAIETWNEPWPSTHASASCPGVHLRAFFKPKPNPTRWASLVRATYNGVNAVNPAVPVLAGGFAPTVTAEYVLGALDKMPMKEFLIRAYQAQPSIKNHLDGHSFHMNYESLDYGAESLWAKTFFDIRAVRSRFGDGGVPLWLTEFGISTTGPRAIREDGQAWGLLMQYRRAMTMPDVKALIIHNLADRYDKPATSRERGEGVITTWDPFDPKLAYCAFAGRVNTADPYGPCWRIVDSPTSTPDPPDPGDPQPPEEPPGEPDGPDGAARGCSERLIRLTAQMAAASGAEWRAIARRHRRVERRCIPCTRKLARVTRKLRRADGDTARSLIARKRRLERRCAPCTRRLHQLERASVDAHVAERAAYLQAHERIRRRCAGLRRR